MASFFKDRRFSYAWDSLLLVNASAIVGFLYLMVHPVLGRMMPDAQYASFVSLMGLLNVLSVPSSAVRIVVARFIAEYAAGNEAAMWVTIVRRAVRRITIGGVVALAAWLALAPFLRGELKAPSTASVAMLGLIAFMTLYSPVIQGTLQGAGRFGWMAASSLLGAVARLGLCALAGSMAAGVTGGMTAVAVSTLISLLLGCVPFYGVVRATESIPRFDTGPAYRYLWPVLAGQGALFVLMNADVVLSSRFLAGDPLAAYSKSAMLSRTVLFLAQPVAYAMFPRAVTSARLRVLMGPLAFSGLVSTAAATVLTLEPTLPMKLMYRAGGADYDALVRLYVWGALPLSLCSLVAQYLWARHRTGRVLALLPVVVLFLVALARFHATPQQMVLCLIGGGWAAFAVLAAGVVTGTRR